MWTPFGGPVVRDYQTQMSLDSGIAKLIEFSGNSCDPNVVEAFLEAFKQGEIVVDESVRIAG